MSYFDAAYILKCYVRESGSEQILELANGERMLACCDIGRVEIFAALHRKVRERQIRPDQFAAAVAQFSRDQAARYWTWLPLTPALLDETTELFRNLSPQIYLRTTDAIHLVCAREHGISPVYSNDRHLLAAGAALGLDVRNVI